VDTFIVILGHTLSANVLDQMSITSDEYDNHHILHLLLQSAAVSAAHWDLVTGLVKTKK